MFNQSVSSSAPSMFRARKKKPGEANPEPQNNGRLTGPPMQQRAGKASMFADGRKGQSQGNPPRTPDMPMGGPGPRRVQGQPQYAPPPTPSYPTGGPGPRRASGQMQGSHPRGVPTATPMMADGGVMGDDPEPIGGMPDDDDMSGQPGDGSGPPPADPTPASGPMVAIKPEAVGYHDDPQNCQGCQYFGQDSNCAVLQMQVSPEGGCAAFEAGPGSQPGDQSQGMQMSGGPTGSDDSGNPPLS